jgi:RNA polymerase-binding protein DksA
MARTARSLADKTVTAAKRVSRKAPTGESAATEPAPENASAKKPAARRATAKKTTARNASAEEVGKEAVVTSESAETGAKPGKKAAVRKAPAKTATHKAAATKAATAKGTTGKPAAGKAPVRKSTTEAAKSLTVKPDETPWTTAELDEVRGELNADRERLRLELNLAEHELHDLMRDAGDGAGNDQADVGSTTFERDHEMSLANNARVMLAQTEHALARIEDATYGVCESCGQPIGKMRLMAFPRATLCLSCKQREERR